MANRIDPSLIRAATSAFRSKVTTFAALPDCWTDCSAAWAIGAPSVTT